MKIGILTDYLQNNYGGTLQNYALQQVLKKHGYDSLTIRIVFKETYFSYFFKFFETFLFRMLGSRRTYPIKPYHGISIFPNFDRFVEEHISTTRKVEWIDNNFQEEYQFDAYIVGSDQVWRPKNFKRLPDYYLRFVKDNCVKRISYAASFGITKWTYPPSLTKECKKLCSLFDAISVRENSGIKFCEKYFDCSATLVLDPTLMLTRKDYEVLFPLKENLPNIPESVLVAYILDFTEEKKYYIEECAKLHNLSVIYLYQPITKNGFLPEQIPIELWLWYIFCAKYVVTDSFHGTAFSIIFHREFISINNSNRGSDRFVTLLDNLDLIERLIDASKERPIKRVPIDWQSVENKLERWRNKSFDFLFSALSK